VEQDENITQIANELSVDRLVIAEDNQLQFPYDVVKGQALLINRGMNNQTAAARSTGYLYPYINRNIFNDTLPYLSSFQVFSYGFDTNGNLVPPVVEEKDLIITGLEEATVAVLTLTPLTEAQSFDSNLITTLVQNEAVQDTLFQNLLVVMNEKGYVGINIDFENVRAEDRDLYTEFVRRCTEVMHEYGYQVSVALVPKTSAEQEGLLYEGIDYRALGEIADTVVLMTYEWGYTYGPPMAVAPLNRVREVVEYAITEIPRSKIMLGIPNYGYDWPLPFAEGTTQARTIGNVDAMQLAIRNDAEIGYDEVAQTPYFNYTEGDVEHVVWFEDVRSLQAKFNLMKEYGLRGASYWQLMQWFRANWLLFEDNFVIVPGL